MTTLPLAAKSAGARWLPNGPQNYGRHFADLPTADGNRLICEECGHDYINLNGHVFQAHGMSSADYRLKFHIKDYVGLMSLSMKAKKADALKLRFKHNPALLQVMYRLSASPDARAKAVESRKRHKRQGRVEPHTAPAAFFDGSAQAKQRELRTADPEWAARVRAKQRRSKGGRVLLTCSVCGESFIAYRAERKQNRRACRRPECVALIKKQTALLNRERAQAAFDNDEALRAARNERLRRFAQENAAKTRIVRLCTNCGKPVEKRAVRTCSPECRKAIRQQTALTSAATRKSRRLTA